jgi:hypothetical protein
VLDEQYERGVKFWGKKKKKKKVQKEGKREIEGGKGKRCAEKFKSPQS